MANGPSAAVEYPGRIGVVQIDAEIVVETEDDAAE
jgi:hypothetical protein